MRVLMFSWEYPPRCVGGLAQHVYELSVAMAGHGLDMEVITAAEDQSLPPEETVRGVQVHRVTAYHGHSQDFITWVLQLNLAMLEKAVYLNNRKQFDIIHAHDWLVAYAARGVKHAYHLPLVATIHATEYGRNNGLHNDEQRFISEIEWWLTYEAWQVICCSRYMREELQHVFHMPADKIQIIPNGISPAAYQVGEPDEELRSCFASPEERVVFFIGRLVREKGVQVLLEAASRVRERYPHTKFVIAGRGPYEEELRQKCTELGLEDRVHFAGYIDDRTRNNLYHFADIAVFPSLYEPFGIVALEAMATHTPVIVSDTGGLAEIVAHENNGLKVPPGDPEALAGEICRLIEDREMGGKLSKTAAETVEEKYSWRGIARQTTAEYERIITSPEAKRWREEAPVLSAFPGNMESIPGYFGRYTETEKNKPPARH